MDGAVGVCSGEGRRLTVPGGAGGGKRFVAVVSVSKVVIAAVQNQMQVSAG